MGLHFKHVFGSEIGRWGIVGFTKAQPAATALRHYTPGEYVLLAVPQAAEEAFDSPEELRGKIFGRCTLLRWDGTARDYANPEMIAERPGAVERWDTCAPVKQFWRLSEPVRYDEFPGLAHLAMSRGRLVPVNLHSVVEWHDRAVWNEQPVYHNTRVADALKR